jgi:hypothetical protein
VLSKKSNKSNKKFRGEIKMVKKIVIGALILGLTLCINPVEILSAEYSDVKNDSKTGVFQLEHAVARDSYFKTTVETSQIRDTGETKLGTFIVRNNTRDGFSVSIETAQGGKAHPASTDDGESDIPYGITIVKEGTVGAGIDTKFSFASNELVSETDILSRAGSTVSAATNAEFELFVNIASEQSDILGLAGTYTDTITLTYTDL